MADGSDFEQPTESQQTKAPKRPPERIGTDAAPGFYANSVHLLMSVYDIQLVFGRGEQSAEGPVVRDVAGVHMSPQLAKALYLLLDAKIKEYEKEFAPLPDVSKQIYSKEVSR